MKLHVNSIAKMISAFAWRKWYGNGPVDFSKCKTESGNYKKLFRTFLWVFWSRSPVIILDSSWLSFPRRKSSLVHFRLYSSPCMTISYRQSWTILTKTPRSCGPEFPVLMSENKRESSVLTSVESRFPGSDRSDFNESVFMFLLRVQNRL